MSDLLPTTINVETLPVIAYQGARVITTDLLASLYGVTPKHIHDNYANNASRFSAGKHFYKLEGEELRQFKSLHKPDQIGSVEISPRVRHLTLWTDRGSARHAKILDTDEAWEVYDKLEDHYFRINPEPAPVLALPALIIPTQAGELATLIAERFPEGRDRAYAWSCFNRHFRIARYRELPASRFDEAREYIGTIPLRALPPPGDPITPDLLGAIEMAAVRIQRCFPRFDKVRGRVMRRLAAEVGVEKLGNVTLDQLPRLFGCLTRLEQQAEHYQIRANNAEMAAIMTLIWRHPEDDDIPVPAWVTR